MSRPASDAADVYRPRSPQEIASEIREQESKQDALHEARLRAHDALADASALHRNANEAYDRCTREIAQLEYDLRQAVDREARALVA